MFLQHWYNKFPNYRHRDLFITGESYAGTFSYIPISCTVYLIQMTIDLDALLFVGSLISGHYIPQLAKLMVEFNKKQNLFNLKGIAVSITMLNSNLHDKEIVTNLKYDILYLREQIHPLQLGNPVLEFATDFNSRAEYFWSHGLISDSTYKMFISVCNYSRYVSEYYRDSVSPSCSRVMSQVSRETSKFVDKYDVTLDVCISSVLSQSMVINPQVTFPSNVNCIILHIFPIWPQYNLTKSFVLPCSKYLKG